MALGVLALATPDGVLNYVCLVSALTVSVVGAAFPSFATIIFAVVCFAVTLCQPLGFIGVLRVGCSSVPPSQI